MNHYNLTFGENIRNASKKSEVFESHTEEFVKKFKIPIAFLSALVAVTALLVVLYFALRKDVFNCHGRKREEEEDIEAHECRVMHGNLNNEQVKNEETLQNFYGEDESNFYIGDLDIEVVSDPNGSKVDTSDSDEITNRKLSIADSNVSIAPNEVRPTEIENLAVEEKREIEELSEEDKESTKDISIDKTVTVTKSLFVPEKPSRSSSIRSLLGKVKRPKSFIVKSNVDLFEEHPLVQNGDEYGSLQSLEREDSMAKSTSHLLTIPAGAKMVKKEGSLGRLQLGVKYNEEDWIVEIGVRQGANLQALGEGRVYWQIHVALLPHKKHRFKTKYKPTATPVFKEVFKVEDLARQILTQMSVRFKIYGKLGRTGKRRYAGEIVVNLDCINDGNLDEWIIDWFDIKKPKSSRKIIV